MAFVYESIQQGTLHFVDPTTRESYVMQKGDQVTVPYELKQSYNSILRLVEEVPGVYLGNEGEATQTVNGLSIPAHDFIRNTYEGRNVVKAEYYAGGETGNLVATLEMTYDANGNVITVARR